ncbi:MAG: tRNA (N(6)-L-threonylcarbamoyladenosine(37)-C(2))-methylthiotransferase MtaB [Oscillospiraceae bacterium]|nr:tRNA (N(6)-L-threonylcarbamoyladenosine(37)-C(2))-methylthiotransferase MtaB [Oscillospiraceae bacterium]
MSTNGMVNKRKKTLAFHTLGCKVNTYETNAMIQKFIEAGYTIEDFDNKSSIYIVNTCTVTSIADRKSRQYLRKAKQNNKNAIVVAVGCYVESAKAEIENISEIDLVIGNNDKANIVQLVEEYMATLPNSSLSGMTGDGEICCPSSEEETYLTVGANSYDRALKYTKSPIAYQDFGSITYNPNTRTNIKIQDGCDNFCTYCIIPYVRGRIRSRLRKNIIDEIKELTKKEKREIVITGINISNYEKEINNENGLIELLEEINKIEGLKSIRLSSLSPTILTEEFILRLAKLDKISPHFHLSLQSACDETLKRMNRKYNVTLLEKNINNLKQAFPNSYLATDIIVGFPGETDEEFTQTYEFLKKIKFNKLHVFPYSKRKGTIAANMKNQVENEIKKQRSKMLMFIL